MATNEMPGAIAAPNLAATVIGWLALAVVAALAAVWVPPLLFHSSQRMITLRLTFVAIALGGLLGAALVGLTATRPARHT